MENDFTERIPGEYGSNTETKLGNPESTPKTSVGEAGKGSDGFDSASADASGWTSNSFDKKLLKKIGT